MRASPRFRRIVAGLAVAAAAILLGACQPPAPMDGRAAVAWPAGPVRPVTLPLIPASHRWLVELPFRRPDGSERRALAWVNPGTPAPVLSPALARELGLDDGRDLAFNLGGFAFTVAGAAVAENPRLPGGQSLLVQLFAPRRVEAVLPAGVLRAFAIALDPSARTLTIGPSGSLPARGAALPARITPRSGLVSVEAVADGERLTLVLDPGAPYTWLRGRRAAGWLARHPGWARVRGAVGRSAAAMADLALEQDGTVLRLPDLRLGSQRWDGLGALATAPLGGAVVEAILGEVFWDRWQEPVGVPVDGWLGNNALGDGVLTVDYPAGWARFERRRPADPDDLDGIGLTLVRAGDGYAVGRIATQGGRPLVAGVAPGDVLRRVDGRSVAGLPPEAVVAALAGPAGARRVLDLERDGAAVSIEAAAVALR